MLGLGLQLYSSTSHGRFVKEVALIAFFPLAQSFTAPFWILLGVYSLIGLTMQKTGPSFIFDEVV